mmetsp:Transcript_5254/g.11606  ORF Transcript_5254/g.11606 Transcript_5254/m.11606 type:complete len:378 (-) Transcript_5254:45-1178(-)
MAKITDFIDPRLTVFVFWVFFLLAFRCLPIKRFIGKVFRMMGCSCCDDLITIDEETNRDGNARNIIEYQQLSDERKTEIDGNRSGAILGHLNGFSLTLKKEHMVKCMSESLSQLYTQVKDNDNGLETKPQSSRTVPKATGAQNIQECNNSNENPQSTSLRSIHQSDVQKQNQLTYDETGQHSISDGDIEMGELSQCNTCDTDSIKGVDDIAADDKYTNYTHIAISLPGQNVNGRTIQEAHDFENQKDETTDPQPEKRLNFIGRWTNQKESVTEGIRPKEKEQVSSSLEVRHVPLSCAICLTDFEESERISWASNPECTHVFHEDCIVQWLVTLGRNHAVSLDPNETEFLDFKLECPCCRQDFILKPYSSRNHSNDAL